MIILNATDNTNVKDNIDFDTLNIRLIHLNFLDKLLEEPTLLMLIKDTLESLLYQLDSVIIYVSGIKSAYKNLSKDDLISEKVFKALISQYMSAGHDIAIIHDRGDVVPDIQELAELGAVLYPSTDMDVLHEKLLDGYN